MYFDFCNFVLDGVNHIVQFEIHLHFDDSVVERIQPLIFCLHNHQFVVGFKMHCLNVYVHSFSF